MAQVRRAKTEAKVSQRAPVETLSVAGDAAAVAAVQSGIDDLRDAGSISDVSITTRDGELSCTVVLAPVAP